MVTLATGSDRIDYVRVRIDGDAHEAAIDIHELTELAQHIDEYTKADGTNFKCHIVNDPALNRIIRVFDVWGKSADYFAEELPMRYWKHVIRLDYRCTVGENAPTVKTVYDAMERNKKGHRNYTTIYHSSRVRTKAGGRDVGGNSAISGAKSSDKRITYYQRGYETGAIEGQFNGTYCRHLISSVYTSFLNAEITPFVDILRKRLYNEVDLLCQERIGCGANIIIDGKWHDQPPHIAVQETLLEWIDDAWEKLSVDAKVGFFEGHISEFIALVGSPIQDPRDQEEKTLDGFGDDGLG